MHALTKNAVQNEISKCINNQHKAIEYIEDDEFNNAIHFLLKSLEYLPKTILALHDKARQKPK